MHCVASCTGSLLAPRAAIWVASYLLSSVLVAFLNGLCPWERSFRLSLLVVAIDGSFELGQVPGKNRRSFRIFPDSTRTRLSLDDSSPKEKKLGVILPGRRESRLLPLQHLF